MGTGHVIHVPQDYSTVAAAAAAAADGDSILVAPGIYYGNVVIDGKNVVLVGDSAACGTILRPAASGVAAVHFNNITSQICQLVGFDVEGATGNAPGIWCSNASPSMRRNCLHDNDGGGILLTGGGMALISDNVVIHNTGHDGGGISMQGGGADVLRNIIDSNRADLGGGIFCVSEPGHVIADNVFRGNFASGGGGGIYFFYGAPVTVSGNLFVRDTANHGGGLDNSSREFLTVVNNTFDACVAGFNAGGGNAIWWADGADLGGIIRDNIATNTVSLYPLGGAIGGDPSIVGVVSVDFNAVWNNIPEDYYRLSSGLNSLSVDPLYCNPAAGDYHLSPGSPCLGSGSAGGNRGAFGGGCTSP